MCRFAALVAAAVLFAGCNHVVTIDSDPTGAEVSVNGQKIGTTPATYTETTGWDKAYQIELSKPGYKTVKKEIRQTEWSVPVLAIGGCVAVPLLFSGILWVVPPVVAVFFSRQLPDRVVVPMERGVGGPAAPDPTTTAPPSQYGY